MFERYQLFRGLIPLVIVLAAVGLLAAGPDAAPRATDKAVSAALKADDASSAKRPYTTETMKGKVVWLDEALRRLCGITTDPAAGQNSIALETARGQLLPLVPDVRGWAFTLDERLRDTDLELLVRRYRDVPMLQVIRVLKRKSDGLYEIDYWCDICAIPMFTLKPCDCCQGPTRLRETLIDEEHPMVH